MVISHSPAANNAATMFETIREGNKDRMSRKKLFRKVTQGKKRKPIPCQYEMEPVRNKMKNPRPSGRGIDHGEFDPGSERTLAARLKHASRAGTDSLLSARAADW